MLIKKDRWTELAESCRGKYLVKDTCLLWSFGHSECNMTLPDSHTPKYIHLVCLTMKD